MCQWHTLCQISDLGEKSYLDVLPYSRSHSIKGWFEGKYKNAGFWIAMPGGYAKVKANRHEAGGKKRPSCWKCFYTMTNKTTFQTTTLYQEFLAERAEILKHKWIESEKAGYDIGFERALFDWLGKHRKAWLQHRATFRTQQSDRRPTSEINKPNVS